MEKLTEIINAIKQRNHWSFRIEGGTQCDQFTIFNGWEHISIIGKPDESLDALAERVYEKALKAERC